MWIDLRDSQPKDEESVRLKCEYMMFQYETVGKFADGGKRRLEADCDLDLFFRSKILGWKPLEKPYVQIVRAHI